MAMGYCGPSGLENKWKITYAHGYGVLRDLQPQIEIGKYHVGQFEKAGRMQSHNNKFYDLSA